MSGDSAQNCDGAGANAILLFISSGQMRSSVWMEPPSFGFSVTAETLLQMI